MSRLIQGKDGVVRGVILLLKGHTIERPLQLVFPLEMRGVDHRQCSPARGEERRGAAEEPESAETCSSTGS